MLISTPQKYQTQNRINQLSHWLDLDNAPSLSLEPFVDDICPLNLIWPRCYVIILNLVFVGWMNSIRHLYFPDCYLFLDNNSVVIYGLLC